jgi:hypothetical protein
MPIKKQRRTLGTTSACSNETLYVRLLEPYIVGGSYKMCADLDLYAHQVKSDYRSKARDGVVRKEARRNLRQVRLIVF